VLSRARQLALLVGLAFATSACWEQVAPTWFAQMKEQLAVQALEGHQPFDPPQGTIPLGGMEPRIDSPVPAFMPEAMALVNPVPATAASVERGKVVYGIYCKVCHGDDGMSNQAQVPVARRLSESGMPPPPLQAVPAYVDGFLFTKIRYGKPGMPGYPQIPAEDRWHVVNYLRKLIPRN
jgi:mono/diheme cytochrome c family protein